MRILALTTRSPYPLNEGRALRSYHLLEALGRRHEVHLLSFVQTRGDLEGLPAMREFCASVEAVPLYLRYPRLHLAADALIEPFGSVPLSAFKYRTLAMRQRVMQALARHRFDAVHFDLLHLAEYLPMVKGMVRVLSQHNVESDLIRRRAAQETRPWARAYLAHQVDRLERYEARVCAEVDRVITVSSLDADRLRALVPGLQPAVVPNGVDTRFFHPVPAVQTVPGRMVFVGGFTWHPNLDGIRWFAEDILPRIAAELPEAHLIVVGRQPAQRLPRIISANPRITLLGAVDDIRPHVCSGTVFVVPLRVGGGTRLKILDALAMERAVVSTSIGCEGLGLESGGSIAVADHAEDFARATVEALRNPLRAQSLGRRGRAQVQQCFDWRVVTRDLDALYRRCHEPGLDPTDRRDTRPAHNVEWTA